MLMRALRDYIFSEYYVLVNCCNTLTFCVILSAYLLPNHEMTVPACRESWI